MKKRLQEGATFRIKVIGNSMHPTYKNGEEVNIRHIDAKEVKVGDVLVYHHRKNNLTIHRVVRILQKEPECLFITQGDFNPYIDEYTLPEHEVIGIVVDDCEKRLSE